MLTILVATCEVTLQSARTAEVPLDGEFAADLERMIARARVELDGLAKPRLGRP